MRVKSLIIMVAIGACAVAWSLGRPAAISAQGVQTPLQGTSASLNGFLAAILTFTAVDANKDAVVTRDELTSTFGQWLASADTARTGSVTRQQLAAALDTAMPPSGLAAALNMGGRGGQPQTPVPVTVEAMMAALPDSAPVRPQRPRKVLVLARAAGFVHSSIPLAAKTIEALGTKTGAWTTTISYDAADISAANLQQYDAVFLASTTGAFLDAVGDDAATAARRQALMAFVRGGKGLAGIHAATDSYRTSSAPPAARGGGGGAASIFASFSAGAALAPVMVTQGDSNNDQRLDRAEVNGLAESWFRALDVRGSGRIMQADFALLALMIPQPTGAAAPPVPQEPDTQVGTWPEFNRMIGGYFKYHWLDPQKITVKIDDPRSPLTAMFKGQSFDINDEIYTMAANSFSRENVRVLTSIDYEKMSPADRALEENPRADRDFGLSWIRREGQGRVFYEALGHSERIYASRPILEHLLAGMQYVLGDLQADDTPIRR
jgi:type 1 glutamine amidotransferase